MGLVVIGGQRPEEVMQDTWGHLAPVPRRYYSGYVLFGHSAFGHVLMLDYAFEGLDGNPWTHEEVSALIDKELCLNRHPDRYVSGEMRLYRWEGTYMRAKNDAPRFSGKVRPQRIVDRFKRPSTRGARASVRPSNHASM